MITLEDIAHLPIIFHTQEVRTKPAVLYEIAEVVFSEYLRNPSSDSNPKVRVYVAGRGNSNEMATFLPVQENMPTLILAFEINPDSKTLINPIEFLGMCFESYKTIER